jgi:acetoin utilization deacetylase AcuC-like enzyme
MVVANASSYSPSSGKPSMVLRDWQDRGLAIDLRAATAVTREQLALSHDPAFVDAVLDGRRSNGFGNTLAEVARSLPYTTGALLCAAREALRNRCVSVAPVSGFHHAGYDFAGGFCTFNGVMVTAQALHREGLARKLAILDLDQHWGNGTQGDRRALGHLCRYITRPVLANERVQTTPPYRWRSSSRQPGAAASPTG